MEDWRLRAQGERRSAVGGVDHDRPVLVRAVLGRMRVLSSRDQVEM